MDDVIIVEVLDAPHDLLQEIYGFLFGQLSLLLEIVVQIIVAHLGDDVHVVISLKNIVQLDNILMADFLHDLYFGVQVLYVKVAGEDSLIDHLDCHWLSSLYYFSLIN